MVHVQARDKTRRNRGENEINTIVKTVGDKQIIKIRETQSGPYVLAYLPLKDEWVTWAADEEIENFFWGHYYKNRETAEADLLKRGDK